MMGKYWDAREERYPNRNRHRTPPSLRVSTLSDIEPEAVSWLWEGRIPSGKLSVIGGDPGVGKSFLTLDMAARVTTGRPWPDGCEGTRPSGGVLLSAEDGISDTIRPRLDRLSADVSRAHVIGMSVKSDGGDAPLSITDHAQQIENELFEREAALLVLDPLLGFTGRTTNTHNASEVRLVMNVLSEMAERTGCAIVGIMHLNKRSTETNTLYRLTASLDFVAAARSVIVVGHSPFNPDRRVMAQAKSNLAAMPQSLEFCIGSGGLLQWTGASSVSANELLSLAQSSDGAHTFEDAVCFLQDALEAGPRPTKEILQEADALSISQRTLTRARKELAIRTFRQGVGSTRGDGRWMLALPSDQERQLSYISGGAVKEGGAIAAV